MQAEISADSSSSKVGLTIVGYVIFTFVGYFIIGLSLGILPVFIHRQLGYSAMIAGIVISLQYITTFIFRGYAGRIVDKKGPKPAVISGMIGFAISGVLLFIAYLLKSNPPICLSIIVLTRFMTGFGEGLIGSSPINWAIIAVGDTHTAKAISYNGIASYGALAIGAPTGIIINNAFGMSSMGILIVAAGVAGLFYARSKTALKENSSAPPESFLKVLRTVAPYGICLTLAGLGFGTISTFITLYYAYLNWANAVLCLSVFSTMFIAGRILFARAINSYGGIKTAIFFLSLESMGLLVLWLANTPHIALIGAGVTGLGFSLIFPALGVEAVKRVPGSNKGAALGSYGLFLDLSLGLTGPLIGGVASHFGMTYIFLFSMIMVLIGLMLTVVIYSRRKPAIFI
ncbi:MAG: MFS transporter [Bacteroidota bacterium]|nr:MFS transporter [Bacteroidota bacterium]